MSDKETPPERKDYSHIPTRLIPEDDPIYTEGVIFTFPIRPRKADTESIEEAPSDRER